ncbi:hypothetical protein FSW04_18575 [Baekduia soli]|uniref:PilN domain-containing protein n=1 Tax=Baekduia soli TaxID=496014 RepID=A0A5B8U8U7_9ACTN|nr:PilN domain-containing protein [Baekduia soli]QEC49377.1 hypothetical protein FSW04_18575 [Baekduia soli]
MRAVNLIPAEQQRGSGGTAGRSGGGAYILIGALALLVVMATAYVISGKSVNDKKSQLASVTRQAEAAEAQLPALTNYTRFTSLRAKRVATVTQLANSRFDWAHSLRELARVVPRNAWLTSITGTTSPGVNLGGGSGGAGGSSLRTALPVPAIVVAGCTTSQASVARMMTRLRLIDGVQSVALDSSQKVAASNTGAGASGGSGGGADCRNGHSHFPQFTMVVFYESTPAVPASVTTPAAVTASSSSASTALPATSSATAATPPAPKPNTSTPAATGGTTP